MWRRPLNSAALATATQRELERVSDGTSTQIKVRIINKWRVKMIQKRIYKVKDSSWKGIEKQGENSIAIEIILISKSDHYIQI